MGNFDDEEVNTILYPIESMGRVRYIYLYTFIVDFYGYHIGQKYTVRPMDPSMKMFD